MIVSKQHQGAKVSGPVRAEATGESRSGRESGFQGPTGAWRSKGSSLAAQAVLLKGTVGADIKEGSALPAQHQPSTGRERSWGEARLQLQDPSVLDSPQLLQFPAPDLAFTKK